MNTVNTSDRRKDVRIVPSKCQPINININGEDFIDIVKANDISVSGIGITVPHGFEKCNLENHVSFVIELPLDGKKKFVQVKGKIKHVAGNRFGVQFRAVPDMANYSIKKYIASRIREESFIDWMKFKVGIFV